MLTMTPDPWHFPRLPLAKQYLAFFDTGVSNALILFQQRRYGKTEFCLYDLVPAAEAQGQMIHFLKNLAIMGGMVLIFARGPGPFSIDKK